MRFFETLLVAISTYSAIPVPQFEWNDRNTGYPLCFFPVVGLLCGGAMLAFNALCNYIKASELFFAAVATCIPLLITGGIHLDGYMDTVDAIASHQTQERMLEIMKDSHCGAFAVIYCVIYLILDFALFSQVYLQRLVPFFCFMFVLSRVLSALCAINLPNARGNGMLAAFTKSKQRGRSNLILVVILLLVCGSMVAYKGWLSLCVLAVAIIWTVIYRGLAIRRFGGVTGDTSGFFLQICEILCLLFTWIGGLVL